MDKSSRNIIAFIATITVAALLIMAARNYADSQKTEKPADVAEKVVKPETKPADANAEALANPESDMQNPDEEIVEEDAEIIMGEPSVNLEQGGNDTYAPPPGPTEQPVQQ
jgi:hypothetical protein